MLSDISPHCAGTPYVFSISRAETGTLVSTAPALGMQMDSTVWFAIAGVASIVIFLVWERRSRGGAKPPNFADESENVGNTPISTQSDGTL